jgi:hypothetical protein
LASILLTFSCTPPDNPNTPPDSVIWAWERPEDLRFLDPNHHAVAFLAQTLILEKGDDVEFHPRRQPLQFRPGTYLIAVTRIETSRNNEKRPNLSQIQRKSIVQYLKKSIELSGVRSVQIDFDAVETERDFYRDLITETRDSIDPNISLTITALTSWCLGDKWLERLPIDDAVPMLFDIGPNRKEITDLLERGDDFSEPTCRNSYGLSVSEPPIAGLKKDRRIYLFKSAAWTPSDLGTINKANEN